MHFTKKDLKILSTTKYDQSILDLQFKLNSLNDSNNEFILQNFSKISSNQIETYQSKEKINSLIKLNNNLQKNFSQANAKILENLNELTETEATKLKISNMLKIFKKLSKIKELSENKIRKEDVFSSVYKLKKLEEKIKMFKEFSFYDKLKNLVDERRAELLIFSKKEAEKFLQKLKSLYSNFGTKIKNSLKDNKNEEKSILFDKRFDLRHEISFTVLFESLYVFKELHENFFSFFNLKREKIILSLNLSKEGFEEVLGFLLIEFFLLNKNIEFDMLEKYSDLLVDFIENILSEHIDGSLKLNYLILIQKFVMRYFPRNLKVCNEKIFIFIFELINKFELKSQKEWNQLKDMKEIVFRFDIRELTEVYFKRLEDSYSSLRDSILIDRDNNKEKESKEKEKESKSENNKILNEKLEKIEENIFMRKFTEKKLQAKNLKMKDLKNFLEKEDEKMKKEIFKFLEKILKERLEKSKTVKEKQENEKEMAIFIVLKKEFGIQK